MKEAHITSNKRQKESVSPSSSPPAKKQGALFEKDRSPEGIMDVFMYMKMKERVQKLRKELTSMWLIIGMPTIRISFLYPL